METLTLLALTALSLGVVLFLSLASEVAEGDTLAFDKAILLSLRNPGSLAVPIGPAWLPKFMTDLTALGGGTVLTMMTALVAAYLIVAKRPITALFVVAAVSGGAILSAILKHFFERPRPEVVVHLVSVSSASFPSGHAMNSAVTYLTLGVLLAKAERTTAVRAYLVSVAILLTVLIGCSRVYLGVHWPTDVAAGWCAGSMWALACSVFAQYLQKLSKLERRNGRSSRAKHPNE